ncbi:Uncharacterised protein [Vibrio cholerae]|uniref:Uncharacterized protein n=1 Tax=Vibrio cholerae TaxID=666 RepID=A0A655W979_VIBCL|nr:Uncharacterised protein [Vibrio cholerae]CRZ77924.1 Uncharacterised protein [Vibrio cholerae]CSB83946.1 Uncharacterised protein [Vibrio cholerae]CSI56677.1 Uncharacterised protein [Vibrio cholerae]
MRKIRERFFLIVAFSAGHRKSEDQLTNLFERLNLNQNSRMFAINKRRERFDIALRVWDRGKITLSPCFEFVKTLRANQGQRHQLG